jgi:hypothetical protein
VAVSNSDEAFLAAQGLADRQTEYHWVSEFAPKRLHKWLSYISGTLAMLCSQRGKQADTDVMLATS